jgi:enoyl-CoA hydratase/carnithine racemase
VQSDEQNGKDESVRVDRTDTVAVVTLHRPAKLNALTTPMLNRYLQVLAELDLDEGVRAIVITGAGRAFCAGADMSELAGTAAGGYERPARPLPLPITLRTPLIAAINGPAVGLGFVLAMWADLRFASSEATLAAVFPRRGLVAEHGMSWLLPRLLGPSRALDLLLSGRTVSATEAQALGLVDRVSEGIARDDAQAYADDLATNCSPTAMAAAKAQVWRHVDAPLAHALDESNDLMVASFEWPDVKEGVAAFVDRRPPQFLPTNVAGLPEVNL